MEQQYDNREFMIFNTLELPSINFNEVLETSEETVRRSINGEKTFVKWDGNIIPLSVELLTTKQGPFTYDEMLEILNTSEWVNLDHIELSHPTD